MNTKEILDQNLVWRTRDGMILTLEEMDVEHRANTLAFLRRNARGQMKAYLFCEIREVLRYGAPPDDDGGVAEIRDSPEEWIERRPLVIELARLVKKDELEANCVDGEVVQTRNELPA